MADVRIDLADSTGRIWVTMVSNAAGNFFSHQEIPTPYTARVTAHDGTVREMRTPQTDGDCARCHRLPGPGGTPGRVFVDLKI